jgi:signal peptidase II
VLRYSNVAESAGAFFLLAPAKNRCYNIMALIKYTSKRQRNYMGMITWLILAILIICLDQMSKLLIVQKMADGSVHYANYILNIVNVQNHGAAFSFLADAGGWQRWFLTLFGVLSIIFIIYLLHKFQKENLFACSLSFILGGAVGNLIDRISRGYVIDFIDFHYKTWHFPAFNIADIAISMGVFCLFFDEFLKNRKADKAKK